MPAVSRDKGQSAVLEILNGELSGTLFPLGDDVLIGRKDEESSGSEIPDLSLPDKRVSRHHARVTRKNGRYFIEDLHSTNGTLLNALRLKPNTPCALREGSNVQLGEIHMRFRSTPNGVMPEPVSHLKDSAPWESEIGRNEEAFDLSLVVSSSDGIEQGNLSMVLLASDRPSPDVSVVLDAVEVMNNLKNSGQGDEVSDKQVLRRLRALAQVSIGLGAETSRESLFAKVMELIFEIFPSADRAFIVLHDSKSDDPETFTPAVASTREANVNGNTLSLSHAIVNEVVSQRHSILSTDASEDQRFKSHDSIIGMGIRSIMCAPLLVEDEVMGIIQVDTVSTTHSFSQEDLQIITGVGAQVAIAMKNFSLYEDIEQLFEGFVTASVHAIEARDPTTAGHSFRVAEYTQRLAMAVDNSDQRSLRNISFSPDQMRELRYAALLHDFGKVGVREHVLIKANKLYFSELEAVQARFQYARASLERQAYRDLIEQHSNLSHQEFKIRYAEVEKQLALEFERMQNFMEMILSANEPSIDESEVPPTLKDAANFYFPGENGESIVLLNEKELDALTLARGSLTPEERRDIQSHVSHTFAFLSYIPWKGSLSSVADIAHAHHEKLDGSGYPLGLSAENIPIQARIMTVADIFDALTAGDRPYKLSVNVEVALDMLNDEARLGKVDANLVDIFIHSGAYQPFDYT